jgi:DNA-binding MarR family transcriptional regulator
MARDRRVTRQRIQSLVDSLLTMELVDRRENARNRRSPLIELTAKGRRTIQSMRKREGQFINTSVSEKRLSTAASVLKEVRSSLEEGPAVDQKAVAK